MFKRWYIDTRVYSSGPDEKYLTLKIDNTMHKKYLKCDAINEVSTQTASIFLDITCNKKIKHFYEI